MAFCSVEGVLQPVGEVIDFFVAVAMEQGFRVLYVAQPDLARAQQVVCDGDLEVRGVRHVRELLVWEEGGLWAAPGN